MKAAKELEQQNAALREQNRELRDHNAKLVEDAKALVEANRRLDEEKASLQEELEQSRSKLEALIRRVFGRKSERFIDPDQLNLVFDSEEDIEDAKEGILQAVEEQEQTDTAAKPKRKPNRRRRSEIFPENLERKEVVIDLSDEEKEGLVRIGEDIQETAHYRRPIVYILRKIFPKYVRPGEPEAGVMQAERPPALVAGDRYDTSFAAEIIAAKYSYHLPIYRQEDLFASCGIELSRSTLLNIQEAAARCIRPLAEYLADLVRDDHCIGSDDTGVCLLLPTDIPRIDPADPKSRRVAEVIAQAKADGDKSIHAKMWAYRGVSVPLNIFDFTISRHRDGPDFFLIEKDYRGVLLGDCYGANTGIYVRSNGLVIHAACVSHARRKAQYALDNHKAHATFLLRCFGELYDIEDEARGLSAEDRRQVRQDRSSAVWQRMREYLETQMKDVSKKEKIGEAKSYLLNQWTALTRYLEDGRIPIDNNETEQLMKQVAVGRKNWLFIGSVAAGYRTADLLTLCSSAIRNDLNVTAYIKDVLDQLLAGSTDYESLRPDVWAASHPESVRRYRQAERIERASRRDRERQRRRLAKASI
jgi:transposase